MDILINQLGYTQDMQKIALLRGTPAPEMQVLDDEGRVVMQLAVPSQRREIWGDETAAVDFSALRQEGIYTLRCGEALSFPFPVKKAPYRECLTALVDMFYYQR